MMEEDSKAKGEALRYWQKMPYDLKVMHARELVREFMRNPEVHGTYIAVGGMDSITLTLFIRSLGYSAEEVPAISVSNLEDKSIQIVHKAIGVTCLKSSLKADGVHRWTKTEVLKEFGFPVLSKEIAGKIELLQNPSEKNATVRHAIITGETGEYGGFQKNSRMKMSQKWLNIFAGADPEGAALGYKAAPFKVSSKCCYYLKEKPCNDYAKETGRSPYMGLMASEGGRREKALMLHGCNYVSKDTKRSCPFASFMREDVLKLALEMEEWYQQHWQELGTGIHIDSIIPKIYGTIEADENGKLYTTGAQRTGCSMCGFGIQLEKRPHRFDMLRKSNPDEWKYWMYEVGWGEVLTYCGIGWEDDV